jgi:hypothetical protein
MLRTQRPLTAAVASVAIALTGVGAAWACPSGSHPGTSGSGTTGVTGVTGATGANGVTLSPNRASTARHHARQARARHRRG